MPPIATDSTHPCGTCGRTPQQGCWTVTGHAPCNTHQRQVDYLAGYDAGKPVGATSRDAEVAGLKSSLELTTAKLTTAQSTIDTDAVTIAGLQAQVAALTPPPVVVIEPKHPIPPDAVTITPGQPFKENAVNVAVGTWPGFSQFFHNGTKTTIIVPDGQTAVLDGKGSVQNAITAGGGLDILGDLRVDGYVPPTVQDNASGCAVYYGSTSAGSEIDGLSVLNSKGVGLVFAGKQTLTDLTIDGCDHAGLRFSGADNSVLGRVRIFRVNRGGHARDGILGAIKGGRSANVYVSPEVYIEDTGGAIGLWFDVSCRSPQIVRPIVKTGAGKPAYVGLQIEEGEGGLVAGGYFEGQYAVSLAASGHFQFWENTIVGSIIGMQIRQDRNKNSGTNPLNLDPALVPWWSVGENVSNNILTGPTAFAVWADSAYQLNADTMLDALKGNIFNGKVNLEGADGRRTDYTPAQLAAFLGSEYDPNPQSVPPVIAALLAA